MTHCRLRRLLALVLLFPLPIAAKADDQSIIQQIEEFFRTDGDDKQAEIAARISDDPSFDRPLMSNWLHRARLFQPADPGFHVLDVPLPGGHIRKLTARIPSGYDPRRPYPVVYALPNPGQSAQDAVAVAEKALAGVAGAFLIAAPEETHPILLADDWPPSAETSACLREFRRHYHIQADRVYLFAANPRQLDGPGAGDAGWTAAALYADQFAGAVLANGALRLPGNDALFPRFVGNLARLPMLIAATTDGTAPINPTSMPSRLEVAAGRAGIKLPWTSLTGTAATRAVAENQWPADALQNLLAGAREHSPQRLRHCFRHSDEAHAYWLEGRDWTGAQWDNKPLRTARASGTAPADPESADARAISASLGELSGEIRDQDIIFNRKGVAEVTVWLSDGMIQWGREVRIQSAGSTVFHGLLKPDLQLCLTRAKLSYDLDDLRWSAVACRTGEKGRVLKAADLK